MIFKEALAMSHKELPRTLGLHSAQLTPERTKLTRAEAQSVSHLPRSSVFLTGARKEVASIAASQGM